MKKFNFTILLVIAFLASVPSFAQYAQGDKQLNVGIGLSSYYGGGLPIGASFEYGVTDVISVGAQIDYYSWSYDYGYLNFNDRYRYTFIPIAVRGSYHVNELLNLGNEKLDLYAGVALGYYISRFSYDGPNAGVYNYNNSYGNRVLFGIHLGGRYYFKPNLGAFAELGYGVSALKIGATFKF